MTTHTIRFQRSLTLTELEPLGHLALAEHARDAWTDEHPLWTVELDGIRYPFDPPAPEVLDAQVLTALNALMDRFPQMDGIVARDYALTVLYAVSGRCSDCGQVLASHEGPQCAEDRIGAGLF